MREQEYIGCIYASAGKSNDYTILLPFPNTLDVCADDERVGGRVCGFGSFVLSCSTTNPSCSWWLRQGPRCFTARMHEAAEVSDPPKFESILHHARACEREICMHAAAADHDGTCMNHIVPGLAQDGSYMRPDR